MSAHEPHEEDNVPEDDDEMFNPEDMEEEFEGEGEDMPMSDDEEGGAMEEIMLQNDSIAHFDGHKDSIFCIAQHPTHPQLVATGGGDDVAYLWDCSPPQAPVLPASYESNPQPVERHGQEPYVKLEGHSDSVNAIAFSLPDGKFVATAGLDGRLNIYQTPQQPQAEPAKAFASAAEVEEINWLSACPNPTYPNTFALGANDGSVWVYTLNEQDGTLTIVQAFYLHQASCTAGAWTPDGKLLCTVSEDASLHVWDVFGDAAAAGLANPAGQAVVSLTGDDERFLIEGGLFSVAVSPGGALVAVGGAEGQIRVVGLPRLSAGGSKQAAARGGQSSAAAGQSGVILAALAAQSDGIETLSFAQPPLTLLAAGSVDGSIALFDVAHNFAIRRHIKDAHEEEAVIKVEFVNAGQGGNNWMLTSCGNDGVVRRWDVRGGTAAANGGLSGEWKGHRGGGEGGGVMGFVQGGGGRAIVTAGDDSVSLVFNAPPQ
ncbi:WD40 repeat-like protein [Aureobasidium namibiae CBS 147.97]|uniref:WD40 repeat-like protein n=1 Tax=Aureobasidium namibiae CBS 147.97 TaxID=1043004 RepID=A0A074WXW8_9PEZI|nr:WD40 repeat-like protein [Aureobasidium namibiae CBS 147.97]KEQ78033.1 WD40 repeat-like protein [Aureobasidium namibiae CBS 147.97]